jgi:hypothetical protein
VRIARLFVPIALAGLVLAGCAAKGVAPTASPVPADNGVKALSADEILNKATAALNEAGSFRVKGDMTEEGQTFSVDLKIKGKDAAGTVALPDGSIKILRIGNDAYFQADAAFWKKFGGAQGDAIAVLFKDKWVKTTTDSKEFAEFADMADPEKMLKPTGTASKGDEKTINGQATIGIKDSATGTGVIYIATTGKPYPVRLEGPGGQGAIDFSDFGATFEEIKAPAASEVVDLSAFIGGGK